MTKICGKCGETKVTTEFYKKKASRDGLQNSCKCCTKSSVKSWKEANPEKVKEHEHSWRMVNPERKLELNRAWQESNQERYAAMLGKSSAVFRGAEISEDFDLEGTVPFYVEARRLTEETGVPHEVDHIISIANGGLHCASNLQVLTREDNLKKGKN